MAKSKFWDRLAESYSKQPIENEKAYQQKLKLTQQLFRPDFELFEFGCGTGGTALIHAPHVKHIRAVDISENMLSYARQSQRNAGVENVDFEQGEIGEITLPHDAYDMVLGLSILHLIDDKEDVIAQIYDSLKPGGYFVSSTVCLGDGMFFLRILAPLGYKTGRLPKIKFFSEAQLMEAIKTQGFSIETTYQPDDSKAVFIIAQKPESAPNENAPTE